MCKPRRSFRAGQPKGFPNEPGKRGRFAGRQAIVGGKYVGSNRGQQVGGGDRLVRRAEEKVVKGKLKLGRRIRKLSRSACRVQPYRGGPGRAFRGIAPDMWASL